MFSKKAISVSALMLCFATMTIALKIGLENQLSHDLETLSPADYLELAQG